MKYVEEGSHQNWLPKTEFKYLRNLKTNYHVTIY